MLTIGITTHNEKMNIASLMDELRRCPSDWQVIIYDDCSKDDTVSIIKSHPLLLDRNVLLHIASKNAGGPATGRQFIADHATNPFVTLIDGDDLIDADQLTAFFREIPNNTDVAMCPYMLRGRRIGFKFDSGTFEINDETITGFISGIGGRIYNTNILKSSICHKFIGRSEDARINMNILHNPSDLNFFFHGEYCFYHIKEGRKSSRLSQININELKYRIDSYRELMLRYDVTDSYLQAVRGNLIRVIYKDETASEYAKKEMRALVNEQISVKLKRVVFLCNDISLIGGVPGRVRNVLEAETQNDITIMCVSRNNSNLYQHPRCIVSSDDIELTRNQIMEWQRHDTVIVSQNSIMSDLPDRVRAALMRLPVVHVCDAQLSFMIKNSRVLADPIVREKTTATTILTLSEGDLETQRQFGTCNLQRSFVPVRQRSSNTYKLSGPLNVGYVGIADYAAKGTDRLLVLANEMKKWGLPPLKVFTTDAANSPDFSDFVEQLEMRGLTDSVELIMNENRKDKIFGSLKYLIVPSKQESFGTSIVEAFSYGCPVIASSEAPGPASLIQSGVNGFLLESFDSHQVLKLITGTSLIKRNRLSKGAFKSHKKYSIDKYISHIVSVCQMTLEKYPGENLENVFPELAPVSYLKERVEMLSMNPEDKKRLGEAERETIRLSKQMEFKSLRIRHLAKILRDNGLSVPSVDDTLQMNKSRS